MLDPSDLQMHSLRHEIAMTLAHVIIVNAPKGPAS